MKKSKLLTLILALLFGIFTFIPPVFCASGGIHTCTVDEMAKIKAQTQESAFDNCNDMKRKATAFNAEARDYISACNPNIKSTNPPLYPEEEELRTAFAIDNDISSTDLYQYTGVNWMGVETSPRNAGVCKQKLRSVMSRYDAFVAAYSAAMLSLQSIAAKADIKCTCSNEGTAVECISLSQMDAEAIKQETGCYPFTTYHQELTRCPLCGIFKVILTTNSQLAHIAWGAVAEALQHVLEIFFLVLLAVESLKAIGSVSGMKISSYLKSVLVIGLKIAIAWLLLSNSSYIYGFFISPVIEGGLDMGLAIANASGASAQCTTSDAATAIVPTQEYSPKLFNSIMTTVRCFSSSSAVLPAIGRDLICQGWSLPPDLSAWLSGVIMYGFGLMIWLAITFYLIDCTVQLGMLSALVPLFITCWPFDMTKRYTNKGVTMLMNTFFNYVMLGVILLIGTEIVNYAVTGNNTLSTAELTRALNENDIDVIKQVANMSGMQMLLLVACCYFALKLVGNVNSFADMFAQGSGTDIGAKMGGLAASTATVGTKKSAALLGKGALAVASHTSAGQGIAASANKARAWTQRQWQQGWAKAGQAVGLGRFQNQQTGSGIPSGNNSQHGNDNTSNGGDNNNTSDNNMPDSNNNNENADNENRGDSGEN